MRDHGTALAVAETAPSEAHDPEARVGVRALRDALTFLDGLTIELDALLEIAGPDPHLNIASHLMLAHLEGRLVTPTAAVAASGVPYATAMRRLNEMVGAGLIDQRPRTKSGKTFTLHPSPELIGRFTQFSTRLQRLSAETLGSPRGGAQEFYFGGSYRSSKVIEPLHALQTPLQLPGGLRILVHGDPTFMVMDGLKRQFEQTIGVGIHQRAFSIDRLREEALRNAERRASRYDIIAADLPWIGEFAEKRVLRPLDEVMDLARLDTADFHTAGWRAAHWGRRAYGVPSQMTPELLFYRTDLLAEAGIAPPATTRELLDAAAKLHAPRQGRYGIAWNAARGTALGHTFMMACADFGQPVLDLPRLAGGFDATRLATRRARPTIDTPRGREAAEYLLELMKVSPPDILSMSWFERVRPYASGRVGMAFGYTLLAPYFELDPGSPAYGRTGYLPHPAAPGSPRVAPVGGYVLGIPGNLPPERVEAAVEALRVFTSPEAQKLYVQNGSRTLARYSVGADPEVRRLSTIFEAVDAMSWRDELQYWPRPPVPQITDLIQICGEELHDMLRGLVPPAEALARAQERAEAAMAAPTT